MIKRIRCLETNPFKGIDAHLGAINCMFMEVLREEFFRRVMSIFKFRCTFSKYLSSMRMSLKVYRQF